MKKTIFTAIFLLVMALSLPTMAFAASSSMGALDGITSIFGNIIIGLVVAFTVTATMKKQLKSVSLQSSARYYTEQGSLKITKSKELYLGSHVVRHVIQQNNGGGRNAGGRPGGRPGGGRPGGGRPGGGRGGRR